MAQARARRLPQLEAVASPWLARGARRVLGARHLAILEAVREIGSLNAAAKHLRISYRNAWDKIREAERVLGVQVLVGRAGGVRGGGSRLTAVGEDLARRLRAFHDEQRQAAGRAATRLFGPSTSAPAGTHLRLATTTSVVDSGLLALLLPPFTQRTGITVDVLPVGSGAALRLARAGRADAILTHAPAAEARAVRAGDVLNPREVMTNDFVLVGPRDDPAGVRGAPSVGRALARIAAAHAPWLSRGDDSGTHQRERALFAAGGIRRGRWCRAAHAGMADVLRQASAACAYALTDRRTFVALRGSLASVILFEGGRDLVNPYSVLATNADRHPRANYIAAMALIGWLTSPAARAIISGRVRPRAAQTP